MPPHNSVTWSMRGATIVADFAAGFDKMLGKWHRLTADYLAQE